MVLVVLVAGGSGGRGNRNTVILAVAIVSWWAARVEARLIGPRAL